ncbi:outer dense fiber protein 2 isoform X1 [Synchiropus splendidus]|uniref:outer dense fiber protein 2 isoform X1 n=1 Tax=Synchiropus splendidus TaxID=270530 RepID=UPI00237D7544|nr:outer dense fiber protein 2 isoform X1 [Synchiropus splendidus]
MKKSMKNTLISPPIHVHVSDSTPVHVHVRKQRSSTPTKRQVKEDGPASCHTGKAQTHLQWTPPCKTTLRNGSYKWEGPRHQLEIVPPLAESYTQHSQGALQLADLAEQDEGLHNRITDYEKKIDNLMTGVSSLKNEVELRKKVKFLEQQSEQLDVSKRVIFEQEEELSEVTKELKETERENIRLRQTVEKMLQESEYTGAEGDMRPKADALLRKLMEAEEHGIAAVHAVKALRESISKWPSSFGSLKRFSGSESSLLGHHHDLLLQKLETFEATNKSLRNLLRDNEGPQMELVRLSERKDSLLKRLAETEAENAQLVVKLQEKENEMSHLCKRLQTEKENARSTAHMSKSLEQTRAHLQGQLRNKEAENNRLTVQIKNLERAASRQKAEMDGLLQQQTRLKQKVSADKNTLKQATRLQKQRAERNEDTSGQLSVQLLDLEKQVEEALSAAEMWQSRHVAEIEDKKKLEMELSMLNRRVKELNEQLNEGDKGRPNRDLLNQLQELTSRSAAAKLENQSLKATASAVEKKLALSQSELQQVKESIKQYESLVDSYKIQVDNTRAEADEYRAKLAQAETDAQAVRREVEQEVEQVRRELLTRVTELESLPDTLRYSEQRLQDAQDKMRSQERRSLELSSTLTELRLKVESQGSQMELLKHKNKVLMSDNKELQQKAESLERQLEEMVTQNSDLTSVISKREEIIQNNQSRLQDKTRECSLLSKRLDEALADAHQQMSQTRERAAIKESTAQAKILDLETQLSRTTSEINQMQRYKDEVERRYKSRLLDLKDRLQQSDRTNKSLQNYVQFLKSSYAVMEDTAQRSAFRSPSPI